MKYLIITLICLTFYGSASSQPLTVEYINDWLKLCEPLLDLTTKEKIYVIEGVPYEGTRLQEKLSAFDSNDKLLYLDYLNSDSVGTTVLKSNLIVIVIHQAGNTKLKQRKKQLMEAQSKFNDEYKFIWHHILSDSNDPVLVMNDRQIHHAEAKAVINDLLAMHVENIVMTRHAPTSIYGANAKNGLVKIWTK